MDKREIVAAIREFLTTEFPDPGYELTDTTNLLEDFFLDSFSVIEVVMFLEQKFGIEVSRADIGGSNFRNIDALSEFVARRLSS